MTRKRKAKSKTFIDTFFDNVLFVKGYRFETSVPTDVANHRLHEISQEMHGWLYRQPRYVVESKYEYGDYEIDIRAKHTHQQYTIAHAIGVIYAQENETIVEGEIRFGVVYLFLLMLSVLWMFFIFQMVAYSIPLWVIGLSSIVPLFNFGQMIYQRNKLLKKIQTAITPRLGDHNLAKSKQRKLSQQQSDELSDIFAVFEDEQTDYSKR